MPAFSDLLFLIIPLVFVAFWCLVCALISKFGWSKLAKMNTAFSPPEGQKFYWESCHLNLLTGYQRCITFHVSKTGLRISVMPIFAVGHPALFFPWSKVRYLKEASGIFGKRYVYDLGTPRAGRLTISAKIHQAILAQTHSSSR